MITPKKILKFKVKNEKYKDNIVIQLERITKEEFIKVKDDKVTNFSILATREKKEVGDKRPIPYEIIDQVKLGGLQNFEKYDKLNPVDVNIRDSEVNSFLARFKRYKYRFVIDNLLFSSALADGTNIILVSCNGLNEAKDSLINGKLFKTLGVINIAEIEHWDKLKENLNGQTLSLQILKIQLLPASHFTFAFTTTNLHDILNFEFILLDDEGKLINFLAKEDKVPALTFTIQILR